MCGIIYKKSFDPKNKVGKAIRKAYFRQKSRGSDGFGILTIRNDRVNFTRTIWEHQILKALKDHNATEVIFHHRIPTSTENSTKYNHPIMALNNNYKHNYYLVHNGIIYNRDTIKKEHNDLNIKYFTDIDNKYNDSECLLHELALVIEGVKEKEDFEARGSMAFIMLQTDKQNKPLNLYFGRNYQNPLKIVFDPNDSLSLSSEGLGEDVEVNTLHRFNYKTREIFTERFRFPDYYDYTTTGYNGKYTGNGCGGYTANDWGDDDEYNKKYAEDIERHNQNKNLLTSGMDMSGVLPSGDIESVSGSELNTLLKTQPFSSMDYFQKQRNDFNTCLMKVSDDCALNFSQLHFLNIEQLSQILVIINNRVDNTNERIRSFRKSGNTNELAKWTICGNVQYSNRALVNGRVDTISNEA